MDFFLFPLLQQLKHDFTTIVATPVRRRKTDEAPTFRDCMAGHEVVIEWEGSDSHQNLIIEVAESIEGIDYEEGENGLKFICRSFDLKALRIMVDVFLEKCAKIEQS